MSPRRSLSRLATDLLGKETVDVAAPSAEVDARTIAAVSDAIHRARARRRARRIGIALGAIAAAAALVVGVRSMRHVEAPVIAARVTLTGHAVAGGVVLLHEGREIPLEGGSTIVAGDRLVAASDGRAAVSLSTGSHVIVEGGADVVVAKQDAEQVFDLSAGSLRADVAKLAPNERFVVRTPDAEVEVRGTSFRVALVPADPACSEGTTTRVIVTEGVVAVRSHGEESRVPAGTSWPSCAVAAAETAVVVPPPAIAPSSSAVTAPSATTTSPPLHGTTPSMPAISASELAEQNRLYGAATTAKRNGDAKKAIALYEQFIAKYPTSWLDESAAVERMRLLGGIDHARAREAANAYLARYPHGFARDEALDLSAP